MQCLISTFFLLVFNLFCCNALAQSYPNKPIRLLVGFAPGGGTDIVARVIGQKLSDYWGQQVIVENRAGATGTIAADLVAKAAPDGYTLLMGHVNSNAIAPTIFKKLPYDAVRDFASVTYVGYVPNVLAVHPSLPVKTVKDLIALAKSRPGELACASSGTGSTQHLALEMFMTLTGVKIIHVPYKGSGQAIVDLVGGQVSLNFDTMPPVLDHIKAGRLRALAVTTPKRAQQLPDVPTLEETGLKGFTMTNWYGVVAPAATPRDVITKVNADINKALRDSNVRKRLIGVGTEIGGGTPESFDAFIKSEIAKYTKLVKAAGVQLD
ncbi:MAG TPA: tripartite tricarboxylate transporter substrate binding protein [Burkholderiales bacterium]|nr:tripartite tricarboxylate transporter substrate binding protein [Burkholderiales bacterium]